MPEQRPLPSFEGSRELAYAAVSRAAYHMALGQRDSAETVLRSIVSFGFAFIDNGTSGLEAVIGSVIVAIGRDALHRFYVDPARSARGPRRHWRGRRGAWRPHTTARSRGLPTTCSSVC